MYMIIEAASVQEKIRLVINEKNHLIFFKYNDNSNVMRYCCIYINNCSNPCSASPCNFQSLEVVDRGSETQLQVTENLGM